MSRWIKIEECDCLCIYYLSDFLDGDKCMNFPGEEEEKIIDKIEPDGFPKWCPGIDLRQILTDPENQPHQFSKHLNNTDE